MTVEEKLAAVESNARNAAVIALSEYILKTYSNKIPLELKIFLDKVLSNAYDEASQTLKIPQEDLALMANNVFKGVY